MSKHTHAELEAENARLREALVSVTQCELRNAPIKTIRAIKRIAMEALQESGDE